jgi:hypothetical protein
MGLRFTRAKEAKRKVVRDATWDALAKALPALTEYLDFPDEARRVRGLTISPGNRGGWLAILKLEFTEDPTLGPGDDPADAELFRVVYAGGETPTDCLAELERMFGSDEVETKPDKYAPEGGAPKKARVARAGRVKP